MFAWLVPFICRTVVPFLERESAEWLIDFVSDHHGLDSRCESLSPKLGSKSNEEIFNMNWLTILSGISKLVPYVVAGIEQIHTNETTETKTQLALDALGVATAGANQVLSGDNQQTANVVSNFVAQSIASAQAVVAAFKVPVAAPVVAQVPVSVVAQPAAKSQLG